MPTKAQNEVYEKYGLRKAEAGRAIREARAALSFGGYDAWDHILTRDDVARMNVATAGLVHLSKVWRAYQECDRE